MQGFTNKYRKQSNCFVWIEDNEQAQPTNWTGVSNGLAEQLPNVVGVSFGSEADRQT